MRETKEMLGISGTKLVGVVAALGLAGALVLPVTAGADSIASGMTLVFANGKTRSVAGNVAVPVECLGEGGFCSGNVTLSRRGHRISIPFSVAGGGKETLYVPLRLDGGKAHPRKVHGVAATVQPQGAPISTKEFLFAE